MYNKGKGKSIMWLRMNARHHGESCLLWPYSLVRGYGTLGYLGKIYYAHRVMCELAHGEPPSMRHLATHSCNNNSCVNPDHLSWDSNSKNQHDRTKAGTNLFSIGNRTELTMDQINEIRSSVGVVTQDALAEKFGVKRGRINYWMQSMHEPGTRYLLKQPRKRRLLGSILD